MSQNKNTIFNQYQDLESKRIKKLRATIKHDWQKKLVDDGIVIIKNILTKKQVDQFNKFDDLLEHKFKRYWGNSGFIYSIKNLSILSKLLLALSRRLKKVDSDFLYFKRSYPNTGQFRLGSKSFSNLLNKQHIVDLLRNKYIKGAFNFYYGNEPNHYQVTQEWLYPAKINHNGWHQDTLRSQLKCILLLSNVNQESAPMLYAKKSHVIDNTYKQKHIKYFLDNYKNPNDQKRFPNPENISHYVKYSNAGYIPDDHILNIKDNSLNLSNNGSEKTFQIFKCYGNIGDLIIFESSGFHSGSIAKTTARKTVTIGTLEQNTESSIFLSKNKITI